MKDPTPPSGFRILPFEHLGITPTQHYAMFAFTLFALFFNLFISRLSSITQRETPKPVKKVTPAKMLVVLGSGGHTSEMLSILRQVEGLHTDYNRTYVVSSGDGFSASKASEFEKELGGNNKFDIITVRRARRVHQSILTAPFTTLLCMRDCVAVLYKNPPDVILTNGPGTGVCVVLASILLRLCFIRTNSMRTTFIESWARVRTLSLSGKILKFFVDRFIVQWPQLVREYGADTVEYIGPLVR